MGRQLTTTCKLITKYLQDYAADKWKCSNQNRVAIYAQKKKGPQITQEHFLKGNFSS